MSMTGLVTVLTMVLAAGENPLGFLGGFMPIIIIFLIFYLLIFRPEAKKRKERRRMVDAVVKGDTVVTSGGIRGVVKKVEDREVVVQIDKDKDVRVHFLKAALIEVLSSGKSGPQDASAEATKEIQERARR